MTMSVLRAARFVCLALVGSLSATAPSAAQSADLEIITPHNENIQTEFERAFVRHVGREVRIRWIKKGTGQIIQQLEAQERGEPGGSFGIDLFFGGGVPDHDLAAQRGYTEPAEVPAEILKGIPEQIAGVANFDPQKRWLGAALSSFGVLMNTRGLSAQRLPEVQAWTDLAEPRMYSWVVIADPRKSASVRVSYELILQQHGWDAGWPILMQIAANSRRIADSSSSIPNEVAAGDALAGPCIDFYAYGRVAEAGPGVLAYVNPQGGAAVTPDPISLLRRAPHKALANEFIAFVLSPAGQKLWVLPAGAEGGPVQHALFRLPVRADIFATLPADLPVKDPYKEAAAGVFRPVDDAKQRSRNVLISELIGVGFVDQHKALRDAWKALIDGGMKSAALEEWKKLPFSEQDAVGLARKLEAGGLDAKRLIREWSRFYEQKYEQVRSLSK
jgi:ABC-type Fe3+ transport system substrate-binding protein